MAVVHHIDINTNADRAFQLFVADLRRWWPPAYTWSADKLEQMTIDAQKGGRCTEVGPNGFSCDWGTVTTCEPGRLLALKWQIGPHREPVPDPDKATDLRISFEPQQQTTRLVLLHTGFHRHGDDGGVYEQAMNSEQGWPLILQCFADYVNKSQ